MKRKKKKSILQRIETWLKEQYLNETIDVQGSPYSIPAVFVRSNDKIMPATDRTLDVSIGHVPIRILKHTAKKDEMFYLVVWQFINPNDAPKEPGT